MATPLCDTPLVHQLSEIAFMARRKHPPWPQWPSLVKCFVGGVSDVVFKFFEDTWLFYFIFVSIEYLVTFGICNGL
jgi:hypothetical protein